MRFISTRGLARETDLRTAVLTGLAPDGGLYMPTSLDPLPGQVLNSLRGSDFPTVAQVLSRHLFGDTISAPALDAIVRSAFDFPLMLSHVGDGTRMLELFHGPTLAFKDVGARFMARLVAHYSADERRPLTVLAATSGDTGSAVAHAFLGLPSARTVVLFPRGGVSDLQERQFSTLGGNVHALSVEGVFDDCQRLVKAAFADTALSADLGLTSANSINVARLLPQSFYYVWAWAQLPPDAPAPVFSVPSGNFGNLAAGLIAHRLGMPLARFVAATNRNDVVPDYLRTGEYRPRPSVATISNAMDVGEPSNFSRIGALYDGDVDRIRADVFGSVHSDPDTRARIGSLHRDRGVVVDPHTAVAHLALDEMDGLYPGHPLIFLATAHPAKFPQVVEPEIGTSVPLPSRLARCLDRERRITPIEPTLSALRRVLLGL